VTYSGGMVWQAVPQKTEELLSSHAYVLKANRIIIMSAIENNGARRRNNFASGGGKKKLRMALAMRFIMYLNVDRA
jgi:hypothetical protein